MAPRVAKTTLRTVATKTRPRIDEADEDGDAGHGLQARGPGSVVVEAGTVDLRLEPLGEVAEVDDRGSDEPDDDEAGDGQVAEVEAGAEPRLEERCALVVEMTSALATPEKTRDGRGVRGLGGGVEPSIGRTWMVISRRTSPCQSREASRTSVTAPSVRQARKLMMATTTVSALPATVFSGTS